MSTERATPIEICETSDNRLAIVITTPGDFAAIYITPGAAYALLGALLRYFEGASAGEEDPDDAA